MRRRGAGRDGEKERRWREAVKRWAKSGLSVREFCRRRGLSEPSFYGWRRTLAQRSVYQQSRAKRQSGTKRGAADQTAAPPFLPVTLSASPFAPAACEIVSPAGWQVRLAETPTNETLLDVLRFLSDQASSLGRQEGR
jgi:hypothetical protein